MVDILKYAPLLADGALVTVKVSVTSLVIGTGLGVAAAIAAVSNNIWLKRLVGAYAGIVRSFPELLIIFVLFYGGTVALSRLFGGHVEISAFWAGSAALSIVFGAYASEIFRGAISSIPRGQFEAAQILGLSKAQLWKSILLPQVAYRALPGIGNQWLILLKDSSLVSIVGIEDVMRGAAVAGNATRSPLTFYLVAAAIYLVITAISVLSIALLERSVKARFV